VKSTLTEICPSKLIEILRGKQFGNSGHAASGEGKSRSCIKLNIEVNEDEWTTSRLSHLH
jgi:hypothetical protein